MTRAGEQVRGFSLLELVVVLAVLAGTATLVLPRIEGTRERLAVQVDANRVAAALRIARADVLRTSSDRMVTFDVANRVYWSDVDPVERSFDLRITVALDDEGFEWVGTLRRVRFRPDGSATGGAIVLSDGASSARVVVDWLTGATRLSRY